jgi:ABC-type proline/glycine betaine transport system permease subunit
VRKLIPVIAFLTLMIACTDEQLATVSKSLLASAKSIGIVQTTVIQAEKQGTISESTCRLILEGCVKANEAGLQAVAITRTISKLDPVSRQQMTPLVQAALSSIQANLMLDLTSVKNEQTRAAITSGLTTAQTLLTVALTTLQSGG